MSDLISRQAVIDMAYDMSVIDGEHFEDTHMVVDIDDIRKLPSVQPIPKKGEWIYDKNIENWRCSRCGQTPPPTGYVGKADFMATHFKFCPNCGADMRGEE